MDKSLKLIWVFVASLLVALASMPLESKVMKDLYTASWPVKDQTSEVRDRALGNAFAQVLVRASGNEKVLNSAAIKASIDNASDYMRLYSYQKLNLEEQKIYRKPLLLKVSFEPGAITNLLKDSAQPIWNENRPLGAFWIATDVNGQRDISADEQGSAAIAVRKQAYQRGLPVILPLMDLEDKSAVSAADVWGKFSDPVRRASRRYDADYIAMGALSQGRNGWQGSWRIDFGNDAMSFTTSGNSSQQVVSKMVNRVADRLALKLAVVLNSQIETDYLKVKGLTGIEAYAKAQSILKNLSMVSSVDAIEVKEDEVLFKLGLQSSTQYLIDALQMSNNLRRTAADPYGESSINQLPLVYNWRD